MGKRPPNKVRELGGMLEEWRDRIVQLRADMYGAEPKVIKELSELASDLEAWRRYVYD